ncbi:hypothetical protein, conserved [Trypanosoma brucei gambiense DAL972]|uniref:RING-type domain-containing protein n=1 Tax=Trypanosoma brucei gambiense (strain MHOM/CI/86/DAL972) TaxID=679716 RepID=C9ZIC7_TRYB9|nr:hypothetical protein, conserved [Trypanosoma brucei gambiense DAL972]CBH08919.1 hypothetical protein, conserved [Trypanosoma brucei gambiense DAL972]|eukprot:XP_011771360.1 hypothetical protein, conserved [Trypanosoma brucei gambiense DAL972]
MNESHMCHQRPVCLNAFTKQPASSLALAPTAAVTHKVNSMKVQPTADALKSKITLNEGLTCIDFQPGRHLLAIGCTKVVHILEVKQLAEGNQSFTPTRSDSGKRGGAESEAFQSSHLPHSSGHMGLRQCGTFCNISKVEAVAWYPDTGEDVLAFVQRNRNITILFDTISVKSNRRVTKQWIHKASDRCLISSMEAGSSLSSTAVVNALNATCTPIFGGSAPEVPHPTFHAKRDREGRGMVEVIIPTGHNHVERIAWDPHNAYTLALAADATHFELWHIPVVDDHVHMPRLILRPPAHDERSTTRSVAFSPSNPNLIVVAVQLTNAGKVMIYDRRHVEVPRCVTTMGPCFAASFHPVYCDLLAVCCRKTKAKTDSRVQFFRVMDEMRPVGVLKLPAPASVDSGATTFNSTGANSGWPVTEQNILPPIDTVDPLNRLRWRPAVKGSQGTAVDVTVDSAEAIIDKISSQLWFATTSINGQEVSVWDASNVFCPIFSIKSISNRRNVSQRERTLREPTDCVWVNALTLVCVFKDGEVELISLFDEATESNETLFRCASETTTTSDPSSDTTINKMVDPGTFSLAAVLPTAAIVPDFFGQCLVVRNSSSALREYYANAIRADKGKILELMLLEYGAEWGSSISGDGITSSSAASFPISGTSSSTGLGAVSRGLRGTTRIAPVAQTPADRSQSSQINATLRHSHTRPLLPNSGSSVDRSRSPFVLGAETPGVATAGVASAAGRRHESLFPFLISLASQAQTTSTPRDNLPTTSAPAASSGDVLELAPDREKQQEEPHRTTASHVITAPPRRSNSTSHNGCADICYEKSPDGNARTVGMRPSHNAFLKQERQQMPAMSPSTPKIPCADILELVLPAVLCPNSASIISPLSLMGSGSDYSRCMLPNAGVAPGSCKSSEVLNSPLSDLPYTRGVPYSFREYGASGRSTSPRSSAVASPIGLPKHSLAQPLLLGVKSHVNPVIEHHIISSDMPNLTYVERLSEHDAFVRYAREWDVGYDVARKMISDRYSVRCSTDNTEYEERKEGQYLANKRYVDRRFARLMAHNAKVCFIHERTMRLKVGAYSREGIANSSCETEERGLCNDLNSFAGQSADIRGSLWASAKEIWRNHNVPYIASHVALLLDYASLTGDVQFCTVLYLLFCLWWEQRHGSMLSHPCPFLPSANANAREGHNRKSSQSAVTTSEVGGCSPQRWRLRALQWVEQYASRLYAMKLYVPINELLLVVPHVLGDSNSGLPRSEEIAQKLFTYLYCGVCRKTEIVPHHTMREKLGHLPSSLSEQLSLGRSGGEDDRQAKTDHSSDECTETCDSSGDSTPLSSMRSSSSSLSALDGKDTLGSVVGSEVIASERMKPTSAASYAGNEPSICGPVTYRNAVCRSCTSNSLMTCMICEEEVEGMYMWLRCCGHGGHVQHIEEWLSISNECPLCGVPIMMKE